MRHYNSLPWPQNAGNPISEDLDCRLFSGTRGGYPGIQYRGNTSPVRFSNLVPQSPTSAPVKNALASRRKTQNFRYLVLGLLPCIDYVGMWGPKGYGFSAVLVINRVKVLRSEPHTPTKFFWEYTHRSGYFASVTHSRVLLTGDFNFPFSSSLEVKANEISELTSHFLITDIRSNFTALLDVPCSPPQTSDVTFNAILIGRVNSREEVFSALQCIDACVHLHSI